MAVAETLTLRARSVARAGIGPGAAALSLAVPFLFLHIKYQPGVRVPLGSTHLGLELSDAAVVVVGLLALREGVRAGFAPLRPALPLWIASVALILWIFIRSGSLVHLRSEERRVGKERRTQRGLGAKRKNLFHIARR